MRVHSDLYRTQAFIRKLELRKNKYKQENQCKYKMIYRPITCLFQFVVVFYASKCTENVVAQHSKVPGNSIVCLNNTSVVYEELQLLKKQISATPTVYSLRSIEELESKHADKLSDTTNVFQFKDTKSSLQYNHRNRNWVEVRQKDPADAPQIFPLEYWIPASYCLDSTSGSGGTISRIVTVLLEAAVENYVDLYIGFPTYAFLEALGLSIGVKVGKVMAATLLFSCAVNKGEILQMQYRPSYVLVPTMEAILYKFKGKKFKKLKIKVIKPFKMLVIDAPEHQCWATNKAEHLQCLKPFNHRHLIKF